MNKAFVREPDEPDDLKCPACQAIGEAVSVGTLARQLPAEAAAGLSGSACFCPNQRCDVGYFDASGSSVPASLIRQPIYPKRADAPICACTGLTAGQVITDAKAGDPARLRKIIATSATDPSRCMELAANGRPCQAQLQKLYLLNNSPRKK